MDIIHFLQSSASKAHRLSLKYCLGSSSTQTKRPDVLTIIGCSLLITAICIPATYSYLSAECPGKDVLRIREEANNNELSFILYYVSWCHESRAAKQIYDEVAQHYFDQVNFAAVNCWHFECNCSYTFPTSLGSKRGYPHKWPTLLVRYGRQVHIQYNDDWSFRALSSFVDNLYHPVLRINSREELKSLNMRTNAVFFGLFPNHAVAEYRKFNIAAVKWLESDPKKLIRFAVGVGAFANDIAKDLGIEMPIMVLITDKEYEIFNQTSKWNAGHLIMWVKNETKRLRNSFVGYSTPSLLVNHIRQGPVLTVFINTDTERTRKSFYSHMIEIMKALGYIPPYRPSIKQCELFWGNEFADDWSRHYASKVQKEFHDNYLNDNYCESKPFLNVYYTPFGKLQRQYTKAYLMKFQSSVQQLAEDPLSTENLLEIFEYNECLKVTANSGTPEIQIVIGKLLTLFVQKVAKNSLIQHNRTMSVHFLNSNKYRDMMVELGIKPKVTHKTTAIIIEPSQEGVFIMRKPCNYETLLKFIQDYYNDNLEIFRRSSAKLPSHSSLALQFIEINREHFLNSIQHFWSNTTTVLLLYSPRCAISSLMSHVLTQVAVLLQSNQHQYKINLVRLNTQTNDLPWEYVMQAIPALIVLPRGHPVESRLYPPQLKIDVRNIYGFILAQLEPLEQLRVALSSCSLPTEKLLNCLHFVKSLATQHISDHLRMWHKFKNDRHAILNRLRIFKDITLNIQSSIPL